MHSTSFARFEITQMQSKSLTCKSTIPGQLLEQTSPSESSWALLVIGHASSLCTQVFFTCLSAVTMHTQISAAVLRLVSLYYLCQL